MGVVSYSAVSPSLKSDRVYYLAECFRRRRRRRRFSLLVAATNVTGSSSWFQRYLPHSFWLSVEGEQL